MPTTRRTITLSGVGTGGGGGGGGTNAGLFGLFTITPAAGHAAIDIAANGAGTTTFNFKLVVNGTPVIVDDPKWTGGTLVAGIKVWLYVIQDATGSRPKPVFVAHSGLVNGFSADIIGQEISPDANLYTGYQMTFMGTIWVLDYVATKRSLT